MPHSPIQEHIELIAKHEEEFLSRRTWDEKVGDAVSGLVGRLTFVAVHVVGLVAWLAINLDGIPAIHLFDLPPFPILDLLLSFESILLASFILMRQSRIARRSDERNHLELQLMLLIEKELTATLGICREIAAKMGLTEIVRDREIEQLQKRFRWIRWPRRFGKSWPTNRPGLGAAHRRPLILGRL
jgi:uncharacterized membrane protein